MPMLGLVLLSALALALWIYHHDARQRPPWPLLPAAVGLGYLTMVAAGRVEEWVFAHAAGGYENYAWRAGVVATVEETAKLLAVLALVRLFARRVTDPVDGLVYGRWIGLGAALAEALPALLTAWTSYATLGQEWVRLCGHSWLGALVGFAVGLGAQPARRRQPRPWLMLAGMALATTLHTAWNLVAYQPVLTPMLRGAAMALALALVGSWWVMLRIARRRGSQLQHTTQVPAAAPPAWARATAPV